MKVFISHVTSECNEHISHIATLNEFLLKYDHECIEAMHIGDIFEEENIELVPGIFAALHPNGMIDYQAFEFITEKILSTLKQHINEIDGLYLQLHGASGVHGLNEVSLEHYLLKQIRKITGKYMPIAVVMDPHGNITQDLVDKVNIVRCYRESPHSDQVDTERLVAKKLITLLKNRREVHPVMLKLPIMVGGERSVSAREPMRTINKMLDEAENDYRVFSTSYHIGYIRHDDDKLGAAVVVIPTEEKYKNYCLEVAKKIAQYAWDHKEEFKFGGNYDEVETAVKKTIEFNGKTSVITDSGDNCGAGGAGQNTVVLREFLKQDTKGKTVLIAGINDPQSFEYLSKKEVGEAVDFELGVGEDELSAPVKISGTLKIVGEEMYGLGQERVVGKAYIVHIDNTLIDVIVLNRNIQYGMMIQFEKAGVDFHDYDIVVVKMGYLDTYLIPETAYHNMALTDGPTVQRSERIPFKKICRPMWPIDQFDELYFIK